MASYLHSAYACLTSQCLTCHSLRLGREEWKQKMTAGTIFAGRMPSLRRSGRSGTTTELPSWQEKWGFFVE